MKSVDPLVELSVWIILVLFGFGIGDLVCWFARYMGSIL
jgi:hypothetical protein